MRFSLKKEDGQKNNVFTVLSGLFLSSLFLHMSRQKNECEKKSFS